jgi:lipoprotein-anchoring transpeptidase ErfK/SrfK
MRIEVSQSDSALRVFNADNSLAWFAPVTMGSEHDPLPIGEWKVTGVGWMPEFRYNPDLFWDANPNHKGAIIKAGPNSPVGVVWIDINVEHYGLHGTPEPGRVGHTASHGCVRLTNWDAARLTAIARAGMAVTFR